MAKFTKKQTEMMKKVPVGLSEKADKKWDKKLGIKEDSALDKKMDKLKKVKSTKK
jgi:hypothetical protein